MGLLVVGCDDGEMHPILGAHLPKSLVEIAAENRSVNEHQERSQREGQSYNRPDPESSEPGNGFPLLGLKAIVEGKVFHRFFFSMVFTFELKRMSMQNVMNHV
jgi:hypothetical protein